jgi:hypothetical protein
MRANRPANRQIECCNCARLLNRRRDKRLKLDRLRGATETMRDETNLASRFGTLRDDFVLRGVDDRQPLECQQHEGQQRPKDRQWSAKRVHRIDSLT